jgi:hypothetical protein
MQLVEAAIRRICKDGWLPDAGTADRVDLRFFMPKVSFQAFG